MPVLNVTYDGQSQDLQLDADFADEDIRRIAAEGLELAPAVFANFVVDRFPPTNGGETRIYLRPKVPFG